MKVLITGAAGQLGRALLQSVPTGTDAIGLDRSELDLTQSDAVERYLQEARPAVLINAAAYTAVDKAESEVERAYAVNADAVATLARTCSALRIKLVHVSTDFVFDGNSSRPYEPAHAPNPLNVYGASKLQGERHIAAERDLDWKIVRTAWVYDSSGRNFVLTMLRLFRERPTVSVVADQVGTPTSARSLAACLWLAARDDGPPGILHFTDAGVASWYDFAVAIREEAVALGLIDRVVDVVPISTAQYPTAARRPAYSVLDKTATLQRLGLASVHWRVNLRAVLKELQA